LAGGVELAVVKLDSGVYLVVDCVDVVIVDVEVVVVIVDVDVVVVVVGVSVANKLVVRIKTEAIISI